MGWRNKSKGVDWRRGASVTGYGLVVGLISVVALGAVTTSGQQVNSLFGTVADSMSGVAGGGSQGTPANDPPSVTVGSVPPVQVGSGAQTVASFASFDPGPGESGQSVAEYILVETSDPANAVSGAAIDTSGTLTYTPDAPGTADFSLTVRDDGGTADGGNDTSDPVTFSITVTSPPIGTGPCSDATPDAGEEGCDPGDGTIFVGLFDADLDTTQERIFVTAFDLNSSGGLMTDPLTDQGRFYYMDPLASSNALDCANTSTHSTGCSDGLAMTASLIADSINTYPAAEQCDSLVTNGHSDWYLPALQEMVRMYNLATTDTDNNADNVGDQFNFNVNGNFPDSFYWPSSGRTASGGGYYIRFSDGTRFDGRGKRQLVPVRCMRRTD